MSKKLEGGIWVVVCDWVDKDTDTCCDLGHDGEPAMYVDPDNGQNAEMHFQCGRHHNIIKQSEKEEYQLPEGHRLSESTLVPQGTHTAEEIGVTLNNFKPEVGGQTWDGTKIDIKEHPDGRRD
jgi:hypothetical protein